MLLSLFLTRWETLAIGTLFFTFSPILMERAFRHTSLASHYLILFAMYFYFKYRHRQEERYPWQMLILPVVAVGITPYFLPMVEIFVLLLCIEKGYGTKKYGKAIGYFAISCVAGMASAYIIGSVGNGYSASRDGYGYYSMNLNAFINPQSCGGYKWSSILPQRAQLYGQYDGFNYLGVGVLAFFGLELFILLGSCLWNGKIRHQIKKFVRRNIALLLACVFLTCFAVSNVVCFDSVQILEIPMLQKLLELCGIFRASSRLFYPVFYLIILFSIVVCTYILQKMDRSRYGIVVMAAFLLLQLFDLKSAIWQKHVDMAERTQAESTVPEILKNLQNVEFLFVTEDIRTWGSRDVLCATFHDGMKTNTIDCNTMPADIEKTAKYTQDTQEQLREGILDEKTVYVTTDLERYNEWQSTFQNANVTFYVWHASDWFDNYYFMLPNQN